jgi:hypothetical protein
MYYNSWNIRKGTSHCFLDCYSDQGTIIKAKWHLGSKCPSSYSTLKPSIASRILTPTGELLGESFGKEIQIRIDACRGLEAFRYQHLDWTIDDTDMLKRYNIYLLRWSIFLRTEQTLLLVPHPDKALSLCSTSSLRCRSFNLVPSSTPGIEHPYYVPSSGTQQHKDKPPQVMFSQSTPEVLGNICDSIAAAQSMHTAYGQHQGHSVNSYSLYLAESTFLGHSLNGSQDIRRYKPFVRYLSFLRCCSVLLEGNEKIKIWGLPE